MKQRNAKQKWPSSRQISWSKHNKNKQTVGIESGGPKLRHLNLGSISAFQRSGRSGLDMEQVFGDVNFGDLYIGLSVNSSELASFCLRSPWHRLQCWWLRLSFRFGTWRPKTKSEVSSPMLITTESRNQTAVRRFKSTAQTRNEYSRRLERFMNLILQDERT